MPYVTYHISSYIAELIAHTLTEENFLPVVNGIKEKDLGSYSKIS